MVQLITDEAYQIQKACNTAPMQPSDEVLCSTRGLNCNEGGRARTKLRNLLEAVIG